MRHRFFVPVCKFTLHSLYSLLFFSVPRKLIFLFFSFNCCIASWWVLIFMLLDLHWNRKLTEHPFLIISYSGSVKTPWPSPKVKKKSTVRRQLLPTMLPIPVLLLAPVQHPSPLVLNLSVQPTTLLTITTSMQMIAA